MAKSRAQRKAERRAREERELKRTVAERDVESRAQHDTQVPVSGEVAEVEAVEAGIAVGAQEAQLETPDAPKSTRAEQLSKKQKQAQAERQRGGVIGFLASCWAELKKVQWPDRDTLVQATAVTVIFVAVAATYLGVLDAAFNYLVKQIL
jgi:preprotein translocase subunit SecE